MSWIIQISLFSLLSLKRLIYAWVPRGRLQLSSLCLNLRLPVLGNKPAIIINHTQDPPHFPPTPPPTHTHFHPPRNLKSKYLICHSSGVYFGLAAISRLCESWLACKHLWCICSLSYSSLPFVHLSVPAALIAKIFPLTFYLSILLSFFAFYFYSETCIHFFHLFS